MTICAIEDGTVGYGEVYPAVDGTFRVYLLNIETSEWSLRNTMVIKGIKDVYQMRYMKTADGVPCLVLRCDRDNGIVAMELVGGKIRWQKNKEQMGEECYLLSIGSDGASTVFAIDQHQHKLHLFSVEDGTVIRSTGLKQKNLVYPFCVDVLDEYVYVGHLDKRWGKHLISKFAMNVK